MTKVKNLVTRIRQNMAAQLLLLILITGTCCILFFRVAWQSRLPILYYFTYQVPMFSAMDSDFSDRLIEEAKHYNVPETMDDTAAVEAIQPLFSICDSYTSIFIYGMDGFYRAGKMADIMNNPSFRTFFEGGIALTGEEGEDRIEFPVQFQNEVATVVIESYHHCKFVFPYFLFLLFLSAGIFLGTVGFFINRKIKAIVHLRDEIMIMASGDLSHPILDLGIDEIGVLGKELDALRHALDENIRQEAASRRANQDLITSLSHDLRTPLTILNGYLEVLRLGRQPERREEYLNRCLQKTSDIREMTDRMFEYALVSEENETFEIFQLSSEIILDCIRENCDFIRLAGFQVKTTFPETSFSVRGNEHILKRIFNNLFSNILKYGEKKEPVIVLANIWKHMLRVSITNAVKPEHSEIESNQIGLKSVRKMTEEIGAAMTVKEDIQYFTVEIVFSEKE